MNIIKVQVTETGFDRDRLPEILDAFQTRARAIYGADINVDSSTPDGQFLGAMAEAADDTAQAVEDVYNGRDPDVATGQNLTSTCRMNGVDRVTGDYAYVDVLMTTKAGAVIPSGTEVQDADTGASYLSTVSVTGTNTPQLVTCKAAAKGTVSAAGKVTVIPSPVYGLLSVTNPSPSTIVDAEETDEQLRIRRNLSTASPTAGFVDSIVAKLLTVPGVGKVKVWENDQGETADIKPGDAALPQHSVAVVVTGGSASAIAAAIYATKPPGITTAGSSHSTVSDSLGIAHDLYFTTATPVEYHVEITYRAREGAGFGIAGTGGEAEVKAAMVAWSDANQAPSNDVYRFHLAAVAQQAVIGIDGLPAMAIEEIKLGTTSGDVQPTDLSLLWNQIGKLLVANIVMVALP